MKIKERIPVVLNKGQENVPAGRTIYIDRVPLDKSYILCINQEKTRKEPHWLKVKRDDVEYPKECMLSEFSYGNFSIITIYCAAEKTFIVIESKKTEDDSEQAAKINYCPVCGKKF